MKREEMIIARNVLKQMNIDPDKMTNSEIEEFYLTLNIASKQYKINNSNRTEENIKILDNFCQAKRVEGKSENTLYNYKNEVKKLFDYVSKHYSDISTQDVRNYMSYRKEKDNLASISIQNMRQYLKSFFKWLTREEFISVNPMDKIDIIKVEQKVIDVLSDEEAEIMRCVATSERDLAIIDLLSGSAMRVSELCALNKSDVNFNTREIVVFGKGKKERTCFMTGRAKVHLMWYLEDRTDDNEALFVTSKKPYNRLTKMVLNIFLNT